MKRRPVSRVVLYGLLAYLCAWVATIQFGFPLVEPFVTRFTLDAAKGKSIPARIISPAEHEMAAKWLAEHKDDWQKWQQPPYNVHVSSLMSPAPLLARVEWIGNVEWRPPGERYYFRSGFGESGWLLLTPFGAKMLTNKVEWGLH
jgi:hypothetical protein